MSKSFLVTIDQTIHASLNFDNYNHDPGIFVDDILDNKLKSSIETELQSDLNNMFDFDECYISDANENEIIIDICGIDMEISFNEKNEQIIDPTTVIPSKKRPNKEIELKCVNIINKILKRHDFANGVAVKSFKSDEINLDNISLN